MKVVVTEKPSVARELADFLGAGSRREGYYEGQGYQVTWALGHLVTLKEPHEYDSGLKRWSLETLPFVPDRFELKVLENQRSQQQFAIVKRLILWGEELICATDAGREGELIFRYILSLAGCERKPFQRLWLSSLTRQAIQRAWRQLRPGSEFDRLYAAARCRSQADWIVGMNATRSYTVRFGRQGLLWSAGRVQTPVLAMIVQRDDEIRHFKPEPFWELATRYRETLFRAGEGRFGKEEEAQQRLRQVQGHPLVIGKIETREQRELPPLLHDLTELQREMNRRFGLSAAATLTAAQSLYEQKLITYPRTDSRYLHSDLKQELPGILQQLEPLQPQAIGKLNLGQLPFTARMINSAKVTDHHAIIPTGKLPETLPAAEQKVFDAVVTRLIAAFYPACVKEVTTVAAASNNIPFQAQGVRVQEAGWTELYPARTKSTARTDPENQQEPAQPLPAFRTGEQGPHEPFVRRGETTPPKPYSENTLLGAMETAGRQVEDEELKEALKERGLGTPATRAAIIETLLKRHYITRSQKVLAATDLGRYLIALVQDDRLKSPELTGQWEARLRSIEQGQLEPQQFMQDIAAYTAEIVRGSDLTRIDEGRWGPCPRCGKPVIEGNRGYGCSDWKAGCPFVLWKSHRELELDPLQVRHLLQHRVLTAPVRLADRGEVILALSSTGHLLEIPVPDHAGTPSPPERGQRKSRESAALGACPLCGGEIVEQKKSYSCSRWKEGCQFAIWKTMAGKKITASMAKTLLSKGETRLLKGFRSQAGNPFDARLKLEGAKVSFKFES